MAYRAAFYVFTSTDGSAPYALPADPGATRFPPREGWVRYTQGGLHLIADGSTSSEAVWLVPFCDAAEEAIVRVETAIQEA